MKKRFLSMLLALVMVLGLATPVLAAEEQITVNVHKILMNKTDLTNHDENKEYDPIKGVQDLTGFFGKSAKEIDKVYFVAIKEGEDGYADFESKTIAEKNTIIDALADGRKGLTTDKGLKLTLDNNAKYKIYEVKHKSTYVSETPEEGKILAESKAIPVNLILPEHATNQNGLQKEIHVYPKNTEDGPQVHKKVVKNGVDQDLASFDWKKEFNWAIEADIPTGFKDYKVFELTDELETSLSYVKGQTVTVKVKDNDTITLEKGVDYTLTEPTEEKGGTLKVALTEAGIKKLVPAEGGKLRVEFTTTINEDAIMSKDIPNKVTLKYGHDDDNTHDKESEEPKVYTGGKKFKKIDSSQNNKALKGATFVVKNEAGRYLQEKDGKYEWVDVVNATPETLLANTDLKQLESGEDGTFEIKGLEYDRENGTKYTLVEVKAPDKYALPTNNEFEFTVNDTSYYKDANAEQLVDADPQNVDNKPITIPQTGGIGTIIFTAIGLAIMASAIIAIKKRQATEAR